MHKLKLLEEIYTTYSEHFEMAGENSPNLLRNILLEKLSNEIAYTKYLEERLKSYQQSLERSKK